jgi:GT2 family glycosyltransferase
MLGLEFIPTLEPDGAVSEKAGAPTRNKEQVVSGMLPVPNVGQRLGRPLRRLASLSQRLLRSFVGQPGSAEKLARHASLLVRDPRQFAARVRETLRNITRNGSYEEWLERFDSVTPEDVAQLRSVASALAPKTSISVVMPVHNPSETFLRRAIESVRAQIYQNWELCIADDCSTEPHVGPLLRHYAGADDRIMVCFRNENGGIAAASNSALTLAGGDYVTFIDHDDEIPPHALLLIAREVAKDADVDLIYTDEDKIDEAGRRFDPYFKPDWNRALILSQNYVNHLVVYRRRLIERVGGFRDAFSGSQDYDLLLRCAELTTPDKIRHVPHVLYHWRAVAGSTARSSGAKPYAILAGQRAVQDALDRRGIAGTVSVTSHDYYQVDYRVPDVLPEVSILVASACNSDLVVRCISRLLDVTDYPNFEVLLLANETAKTTGGQRSVLEKVQRDPRVRALLYPDRPFNFSWINNWGASQARGSVLCFMNDDTEVISPDWLQQMVARLALADVGAVGAMLYYPNDTIQHAGIILGSGGVADHAHRLAPRSTPGYFGRAALEQDFSAVTAGCAAISRQAFESVGGFDAQLAAAFNDVDLCIRLGQAGWRILWTPRVELYHRESATLGPYDSPERFDQFKREEQLMRERWASVLTSDRNYNPNLSLETGYAFRLSFPPRVDWRAAVLGSKRNETAG